MATFQELFVKHGTDKGNPHRYGPVYDGLFTRRDLVRRVLEIGVGSSASLRAWREAFPYAEIYGADIEPPSITEDRIRLLKLDQASFNEVRRELQWVRFDLIVDDGSHKLADMLVTMIVLWPCLVIGGFYVIEDLPAIEHGAAIWSDAISLFTGSRLMDTVAADGRYEPLFVIRKW